MALRQILTRASELDDEIYKIEYNINLIEVMAKTLIENDFEEVQLIMENLPKNGARPYIQPLFPPKHAHPSFLTDSIIQNEPDPVGYARWYAVEELERNPLIMIQIDLDAKTTLALLDKALIRLKQKKSDLLAQSKEMFSTLNTKSH